MFSENSFKMELCMVFQISGMRMVLFNTKVNIIKEKNLDPGTIGIPTENESNTYVLRQNLV